MTLGQHQQENRERVVALPGDSYQPTSAEKDAAGQWVFHRTQIEAGSSPCSRSSAPPQAALPISAPAPPRRALAGSPGGGRSRGHPKFCPRRSALPPPPRPGLRQPAVRDRDPGRVCGALSPGGSEVRRRCRPAARGGRRAPTSGRLPTWAAGAARLRSRRRQSPAGRVRRASARLPGPLRQAPPAAPRARRLGLAPAPRPGPPPTLSQRPEQVQLQRQERPPSAPPARAQLCRRPPAALPRVPAGALGRREGSPGPPPPLGAGGGPPRPPRARRAAAAPGHAEEELPPPAPGLGPRERTGGRWPRAEPPGAGAGGGGGARRRRSCQRGKFPSRRPERPRRRSAPAAPRLPEGPAGAEEETPPPPPPPGAEEKVRPPARRRSPSAAAAPHSQPGRTRRPPAPAAAADWPRGGGSRASRPAPTPSPVFKLAAPARLEFRAGPRARLGGFPRRLRPLGTRGEHCRPAASPQALGRPLGRGRCGPQGWGPGRRRPRPPRDVRARRWAGARAAEEQVGWAAEPLARAGEGEESHVSVPAARAPTGHYPPLLSLNNDRVKERWRN
uniref:Basic salivary proline-rich protein 1-like n=1 Tax=Callorhinus ursinus TaxID=34884 RepID=A0A3Q7NM73_CALUR|nr:basic salivary proline-rich protein 1-like [Callorhinus ursinus]